MSKLKAISLFSGCGGFDYGASQAGIDIIWANDVDPVAASTYRQLMPNTEFILGDVRNVKKFPCADLLIGCYPCTGFSVAARRRWKHKNDRNLMEIEGNFLYMEFLRVLETTQPRYFFVENVRGMVSAKNGWFFDQQLSGFRERGYEVSHSLMNAMHYGVAQSRQRVFIVGVRKDIAKDFDYEFEPPTHGPNALPLKTLKDAIGGMPLDPKGEFLDKRFHGHFLTRNRKRSWKEQSYTIVANAAHVPLHPAGDPMIFVSKDKWSLQGDFNRRLSWRECAAIQGFPRSIEPEGGLEAKYRVIGNAVPPAFGKILMKPIVTFERADLNA
ncbi:DNA (cytosine-5-)-methyltransferase [Desulfobulbus rhabdoformis]|uniref:DNA cytosine methyltransferase n=1 Tax=Desulfobulbus rhabdoformis TaxID=34032 RepID=UPI001963596B|nr:DNA (cytosine-5-)-methyltransferase [Desulfobulbus rhabdoformis]MBM9615986.1 DNA (cytosine-5-)-methyltransferase [Desulfobulbus rhabdoformis]